MNAEMSYKEGVYLNLINRFVDSGYKICEVTFTKEDKANRNDNVISNGINRAIKNYNMWHIRLVRRNDKFYLVNTLISK